MALVCPYLLVSWLAAAAESRGTALGAQTDAGGVADDGDVLVSPVEVPVSTQAAPVSDPRDPTAQVTTIDAQLFDDGLRSSAELLAVSPGAEVHRSADLGQYATLSLRGSSADEILLLIDGIPLTSAAGGTVDLSTLPSGLIDHLDVLRGSAGATYGASAMGGVVNVVTKRPQADEAAASVSLGSWHTVAATASEGMAVGDHWSGSAALTLLRSAGDFSYRYNPTPDLPVPEVTRIRANDQSLTLGGLATADWREGNRRFEAVVQGLSADRGLAGTAALPTPQDHLSEARGLVAAKWSAPSSLGALPLGIELQGHGRVDSLNVSLVLPGSVDQLDAEGGGQVVLNLGLPLQLVALRLSGSAEVLSVSSQSPTPGPGRGAAAAAVSDQVSLFDARLLLVPALRVDQVGQYTALSPKLGATFRPLPALELRANLGQGFRAPSFGELYLQQGIALPNPELRPETDSSADLGVSWRIAGLLLSATGFVSAYRDLILYEVLPPLAARPFNEGQAAIAGVEGEVVGHLWPWLSTAASATFLDAHDADPGSLTYGRSLPYRPTSTGHGRLAYSDQRLRASLDLALASSQGLNRAATLTIPGHATVDAAVGFRLWTRPAVWFAAGIRNLTNNQVPDNFGYPLPGTSVFTTLSFEQTPTPEAAP